MGEIRGTAQADILIPAPGADIYYGLAGNDYGSGGAGADQLNGGVGDDVLNGEAGDDDVTGGLGSDKLSGGVGDDVLLGGGADDGVITAATVAEDGNDVLEGGEGSDALWGMGGNDILAGGAGPDVFYFGPNEGSDIVVDFTRGEDKINLSALFGRALDLDTNASGTLDSGDLGIAVGPLFTVINFTSEGSATTLQIFVVGGGGLATSDFI